MSIPIWRGTSASSARHTQPEDRRTWYLVLQIGFPLYTRSATPRGSRRLAFSDDAAAAQHLRVIRTYCKPLGITILNLNVSIPDVHREIGHYLFRFRRYCRDDETATRLVEAFAYGLSAAASPAIDTQSPLVLRIPDNFVRGKHSISLKTLLGMEECRSDPFRFTTSSIAAVGSTTRGDHEMAWRMAAVTLNRADLFDATRFLQRSYENFYVYPGGICEVMSAPEDAPTNGADQSNFEDALHSAFKAIEAVIGDPPKDDRRFFAKSRKSEPTRMSR